MPLSHRTGSVRRPPVIFSLLALTLILFIADNPPSERPDGTFTRPMSHRTGSVPYLIT